MKISEYILIIIALTNSINLFGSCHGEYFSITELLNHDPKNHHIFTCEILQTYIRGISYESIAVVKKRYIGRPNDTIYIHTGGGTTAGGQKLYPKSEWLIFSTTKDSLHYGATVCDFLSTKINKGNSSKCERSINPLGKIYIEVLEEYEAIRNSKYSGSKEIKGGSKLIARGNFKSGIPDGNWIHYSRQDEFEKEIKRSEISYKNGMLHGKYNIYYEDNEQNIIIEKRVYQFNLPEIIEYDRYQKKYEYKNDRERIVTLTYFDSSGIKLKEYSWEVLDYNSKKYDGIGYQHGYYFNKLARDSSKYSPLAEGNYFRGARIGEWKFFDKKGVLVNTKTYPEIPEEEQRLLLYDEEGNIKVSGQYIDGKRIGIWKYFYDAKLNSEEAYNSNGERISKTHIYSSGGIEFTSYLNNLMHGQKIIFNEDNTIRSIENYENGKLNGMSIFFNEDGSIRKESRYVNSREFTVDKNGKSSYVDNGFLNGHFVQYNYRTKEKSAEGKYWNGYKIGVWTEYEKGGGYKKKYYPTEKRDLMNQCGHSMAKLTEQYDKDENLINSWED